MKKRKNKIIFCLALVVCFSVFAVVTTVLRSNVYAEAATVSAAIEERYDRDTEFVVPEGSGVSYNGQTYPAEQSYLVYPSGKAFAGKRFTLGEVGKYALRLEITVEGKIISAEKSFTVNEDVYKVSTPESFVAYGELNAQFAQDGMNKGILAKLTDGASVTYAHPVNVYDKAVTDVLSFNVKRLDNNVEYVTVSLVDCYDPTIGIDIVCQMMTPDNGRVGRFMRAGQKGSSLLGLNCFENPSQLVIDGKLYDIGIFGTPVHGNLISANAYNNITITLDTTDKKGIKIYESTSYWTDGNPNLVAALNDSRLYADEFPGFTNGDVFVSVSASVFKNVKLADVEIGMIDGKTNAELNEIGKYVDEEAPEIILSVADTGKIAVNAAAKIPAAYALDPSGISNGVDYSVWYNYDTEAKYAVPVIDGRFTPKKEGVYTVVYTATDNYGNKAEKTLLLSAIQNGGKGLEISTDIVKNIYAGTPVDFGNYSVTSLCDTYEIKIEVTSPDGIVTDITKTASDYLPPRTGAYKVKYFVSDDYYDYEYEHEFIAAASDKPSFEKATLTAPKYFIKGVTYSLDDVKAAFYGANGKTYAETTGYISYDGKDYAEIDASGFTVSGGTKAKVKLAAKDNRSIFVESGEIKIIDVGYGTNSYDITKYFVGDFTASANLINTKFTATKSGDVSFDFINPLLASQFAFDFEIPGGMTADETEILLTDRFDRSLFASIKLLGDKKYSINGNIGTLRSSWIGNRTRISVSGNQIKIGDTSAVSSLGLNSDAVELTVRFKNVGKGFSFNLYSVANQPFRSDSDNAEPMLSAEQVSKIKQLGDVIYTSVPTVADALCPSPFKNCKVSVYKDNEVYVDKNGNEMFELPADKIYEITLNGYGDYDVMYVYSDGEGEICNLDLPIRVIDNVAPEASFKNAPNGAVKVGVGESVKPLEVIVKDNESEADEISIWTIIYDERGRLIAYIEKTDYDDDYTFTLTAKGKYTAYIYVSDATGNSVYVSYEITAE